MKKIITTIALAIMLTITGFAQVINTPTEPFFSKKDGTEIVQEKGTEVWDIRFRNADYQTIVDLKRVSLNNIDDIEQFVNGINMALTLAPKQTVRTSTGLMANWNYCIYVSFVNTRGYWLMTKKEISLITEYYNNNCKKVIENPITQ